MMHALRDHDQDRRHGASSTGPVLVSGEAVACASPARILQERLERAALQSFYAVAPDGRARPAMVMRLRGLIAVGSGLLLWLALFAIVVHGLRI
jgi:hypothetical protein